MFVCVRASSYRIVSTSSMSFASGARFKMQVCKCVVEFRLDWWPRTACAALIHHDGAAQYRCWTSPPDLNYRIAHVQDQDVPFRQRPGDDIFAHHGG
jgi:hypothetical protein